jgi:hypothetical protein
LLAAISVFYFAGTALRARSSPFWHDEIYTVLLSRLDLPHMWAAIRAGIDPTPPLADILVRAVNAVWGEGNIVSRLPAMVGFWIFCVCLFAFVRRRLGIGYGLAALLLPISTGAYTYAIQARCYGIVLGCCGLALFSWQSATDGRRRKLALSMLALSLAAALFSHFYGVLLFVPLAGAEFWRAVRRGKPDVAVWAALFAGGVIGLALVYPLVAGANRFMGHPWAKPQLQGLMGFYPTELQPLLTVIVAFLVLAAVWRLVGGKIAPGFDASGPVPGYEIAAAVLLVSLPVIGFAMALLVTHMFAGRYFISAIAGPVLLAVMMIAIWTRGSRAAGLLLCAAAAVPAAWLMSHHLPNREVVDLEPLLRDAIAAGPVIMDDGINFLEEWYYLPPEMKSRLSYVSDPDSDARWVGHDTVDVGMRGLRKWFGVPVLDYADLRARGSFRIYHNASGPVWLPNRLLEDGARLEVLQTSGDRSILRVSTR